MLVKTLTCGFARPNEPEKCAGSLSSRVKSCITTGTQGGIKDTLPASNPIVSDQHEWEMKHR